MKDCGLGERAAAAAARAFACLVLYCSIRTIHAAFVAIMSSGYLVISESLEDLSLKQNKLSLASCQILLRAVGQRGGRGALRSLNVEDQSPRLSVEDILMMIQEGGRLAVRIQVFSDGDNIFHDDNDAFGPKRLAEVELALEKSFGRDQLIAETKRLRAMLEEMARDGSLQSAFENKFFKTVYL